MKTSVVAANGTRPGVKPPDHLILLGMEAHRGRARPAEDQLPVLTDGHDIEFGGPRPGEMSDDDLDHARSPGGLTLPSQKAKSAALSAQEPLAESTTAR